MLYVPFCYARPKLRNPPLVDRAKVHDDVRRVCVAHIFPSQT
jgi:hypothetical protein